MTIKTEKTASITIRLPESLKQECKIKAVRNKTTITELIISYLKEYISK